MDRKTFQDMSLEEQDDFYKDNVKCPICNARIEDNGIEEFRGKFRLELCGFCGYTLNVEM